ncbi:MAG: hypothetical protein JSR90_06595 [Proteobacteria bacterium]|nr:hypothetical protein [Pseudomonadota bacterium]
MALRSVVLLLLAASLGACASSGVQPGVISRSGPPPQGQGPVYAQNQSYIQNASASASPQTAAAVPGESGRVVSINEVGLQGAGGGGSGNGATIGGVLGGIGGAILGAVTGQTLGSGIVGGVLGAVGGAVFGSIFDGRHGSDAGGRGIEVTVQKDDGSKVVVAQRDDGDIQLGDRVQVVQGRNGVAQVVRDTTRKSD